MTLIEVVVAASILSIAALALIELLVSSDRTNYTTRRQALASIEAERALEACAQAIKSGGRLPSSDSLQSGMQGEALAGCLLKVGSTNKSEEFTIPPAGASGNPRTVEIKVRLLVATVETDDGETLVSVERAVPVDAF